MNGAQAIGRVIAAWPQTANWGDATIETYERILDQQQPDVLDEAIDQLIRTQEWPPTIAAILGACASVRIERRRNGDDRRELNPCRNLCDHGWVWHSDAAEPCSHCQPELARAVREGRTRPRIDRSPAGVAPPPEFHELRTTLRLPSRLPNPQEPAA